MSPLALSGLTGDLPPCLLPGLSALLLPLFALVLPLSALHGAPEPQLSARGRCSVSDQAAVWRASELLSYSRP
jgi:hypothetical protein